MSNINGSFFSWVLVSHLWFARYTSILSDVPPRGLRTWRSVERLQSEPASAERI